jgi:branched-chain amino acid transport system permease protein
MVEFFQSLVNGFQVGALYAMVALGLSLIFGVMRVANFAHGALYMVGGMVTYLVAVRADVPYFLAGLVAGLVVAAVSVLVERTTVTPLRKAPEEAVFLSTFGASLVIVYGVQIGIGSEPRSVPTPLSHSLHVAGVLIPEQEILLGAVMIVLGVGLLVYLRRTSMGRVIRAVASDTTSAQLLGINVNVISTVTFATAGLFAGFAGALIAPITDVNPFSGEDVLIKAFIVVLLGGLGSIQGAIICGLGVGLAEGLVATYWAPKFSELVAYVAVLLVLALRPEGILAGRVRHV